MPKSLNQHLNTWLNLANAPRLNLSQRKQLVEALTLPTIQHDRHALVQLNIPQETIHYLQQKQSPRLQETVSWLEHDEHHVLCFDDTNYPPLLREIADPPMVLFVKGHLACLNQPQLAIVGTRKPSATGVETAFQFSHDLASCGLVITSGLAIGIDAAAHRGTLAAKGITIAVLGTGLQCLYPRQHHDLAKQIAHQGAWVSELPLSSPARPWQFPRRNRIMTGLSLGVLVI